LAPFFIFPSFSNQQQQVSWFDFCWDSNIGKTKKVNEFEEEKMG
jgi:hypothetical protein